MKIVDYANQRRIHGIASTLCRLLPATPLKILDVGCGDGALAKQMMGLSPMLSFEGVEVVLPRTQLVPMRRYDGERLPFGDHSFDAVLCADMLHHTRSPIDVLKEACRVARKYVIVKDHICDTWIDRKILTFMDWLGNFGTGVPLPYRFLSSDDWNQVFGALPCRPVARADGMQYWGWPISALVDRQFQFLAILEKR